MSSWFRNIPLWPYSKSGVRRRELRRAPSGHLRRVAAQLVRGDTVAASILMGLFVLAVCLILLSGQTGLPYRIGQRMDRPIVARVDFHWDNPIKAANEMAIARRGTPNYYRLNSELIADVEKGMQGLTDALTQGRDYADFQVRIKAASRAAKAPGAADEAGLAAWSLDVAAWQKLHALATAQPEQWQQISGELLRTLAATPVIWSKPAEQRQPKSLVAEPVVFDPAGPDRRKRFLTYTYDLAGRDQRDDAVNVIVAALPQDLDEQVRQALREYLAKTFAPQGPAGPMRPVYVYDPAETQQRMEVAAKAVNRTEVYTEGQTLVPGDSTMTETMLDLLRAERTAYMDRLQADPAMHQAFLLYKLGLCGIVLATTIALAAYTLRYRPQVLAGVGYTAELLLLLLAGTMVCRWMAVSGLPYADRWAVAPIWLVGAVVALAARQRFAIGVTFAASLLGVLALHANQSNPMSSYVVLTGSALVGVALLGDIRTRTKLVMVGLASAVAAFCLSLCADLSMLQPVRVALTTGLVAAGAAMGASLLLHGLLPVLERLFGIVTGMTLLEWCDINKPLLRRLAREAPGTYNHALVLGSMAEAAAESIGAQGLLTRVGAYYHDIGKINKPRYFVENQASGGTNWHDRLAPTMSLLIIIGHVKDGLELAREYGLPRPLWSFIAEHHGTTLVRYFYRQAAERANGHSQAVAESDFRYPGPKPRSRETAILMLCDGVESAVRTLSEPTPGRIEGLVHQMVMDRLADGQFEECEITLRDLHRVEESIVKSLCAIYHGRIAYPSAREPSSPAGTRSKPATQMV